MTDPEITKLCSEAMGYAGDGWTQKVLHGKLRLARDPLPFKPRSFASYDPLHDDAQAMALVKRVGVTCMWSRSRWECSFSDEGDENCKAYADEMDLNRAICLVVARLQQAKQK